MVFQGALHSLNPVQRIDRQVAEPIEVHERVSSGEARERAHELLGQVGIPASRTAAYPHQLSGGQRQRVMIAMALACNPKVLIADEPTTALDVTVQAQILALLADLRERLGMALLLITHDLGVVAEVADRVLVMYAGRIVEQAGAEELFRRPRHPYTRALMQCRPSGGHAAGRLVAIGGLPPTPGERTPGCAFAPRCPQAAELCRRSLPELASQGAATVACHFPLGGRP